MFLSSLLFENGLMLYSINLAAQKINGAEVSVEMDEQEKNVKKMLNWKMSVN